MIDLSTAELAEVRRIVALMLPGHQVWAFGSRCKGTARPHSDLDLLVKGEARAGVLRLERVREAFQESMLTFRVDLVDWHATTPAFRELLADDLHLIQAGEGACL